MAPSGTVTFRVVHASWGAEDEEYASGEHEVKGPSAAFCRLVAGAESAGALEDVRLEGASAAAQRAYEGHVQDQADGEDEYARMQKLGRWQHGNLVEFIHRRRGALEVEEDTERRAVLQAEIDEAQAALDDRAVPE